MMKFIESIKLKQSDWHGQRQPTIAFLGDSVTYGCFGLYVDEQGVQTYMEQDNAYHEKVKMILNMLYPTVPITVVNAGISGDKASAGVKRVKQQVLSFNPDLVVVCYGLNDSGDGMEGISKYLSSLNIIFNIIREAGAEVIFLTPNHITQKLDVRFEESELNAITEGIIANKQNESLREYINQARKLCITENIPICDCGRLWDVLSDNDVDINNLLSNRINHPKEKMHWMFAYELVRTMFGKCI